MNKIFSFLMVGFAFTVLQFGTVEAADDGKSEDCTTVAPDQMDACWERKNNAPGTPGTAPMGEPAAPPSLVDRFKAMLGMGTEAPPMGTAGEAPMTGTAQNDGPPMDPRSGQPFTPADEAKFQKYADECEASKGLLSEGSTQELVQEGFTPIQVEDLCKNGPQTAPQQNQDIRDEASAAGTPNEALQNQDIRAAGKPNEAAK